MASIWTVKPETARVDLEWRGNAFWLELKRELTEGESRRVKTAGFTAVTVPAGGRRRPGEPEPEQKIPVDWLQQSYKRTLTYVTDWSLADDKGNKLPLMRDTLEAMHEDLYEAIENGITAHVERQEIEKKVQAGEPKPRAISA